MEELTKRMLDTLLQAGIRKLCSGCRGINIVAGNEVLVWTQVSYTVCCGILNLSIGSHSEGSELVEVWRRYWSSQVASEWLGESRTEGRDRDRHDILRRDSLSSIVASRDLQKPRRRTAQRHRKDLPDGSSIAPGDGDASVASEWELHQWLQQ